MGTVAARGRAPAAHVVAGGKERCHGVAVDEAGSVRTQGPVGV